MTITRKNLIFLGPPGVGKGTIAERFAAQEGLAHISTGQLLREEVAAGSELGNQAKALMEAGQLVPDALVATIVSNFLARPEVQKSGFILDGFPRTIAQADLLAEQMKQLGILLHRVISLHAPRELLLQRLTARLVCSKCGATFNKISLPPKKENICDHCDAELIQRKDDTLETAVSRLEVYEKLTEPLNEYYAHTGLLVQCDGTHEIEEKLAKLTNLLA